MGKGKERLAYLDAIRGLLILWMLLVHCSLTSGYHTYGEPYSVKSPFLWMGFFMVPFYFFSGYMFSANGTFVEYVKRKVSALLWPYFLFSVFGLVIYELHSIVSRGALNFSILRAFVNTVCISSNTPCWFFISLLCVVLIFRVLYEVLSPYVNNRVLVLGIAILGLLLAVLTCNRKQYFGYGNVALGLFYYCCGFLFRRRADLLNRWWACVVAVLLCFVIGVVNHPQHSFVLNRLSQGNYFLCVVYSLSATFVLWYIAQRLPRIMVLEWVGVNSLAIFASHRPILNWIIHPMASRFVAGGDEMMVDFAFVLLISLVIAIFVNCKVKRMKAEHSCDWELSPRRTSRSCCADWC